VSPSGVARNARHFFCHNARCCLPQVVKIDSEKYPALSTKYRVQALPTIILFKDGQQVDRIEGLPNEAQLMDRIKYFI